MAEGAVLPGPLTEPVVTGRSLWVDGARLVRNKAAVTGMILLGIIAVACLFGPALTGHPYDTVYPDYVRVPASLSAYPPDDQIAPAVERIGSRVRARASEVTVGATPPGLPDEHGQPPDRRTPRLFRALGPVRPGERGRARRRGPAARGRRAGRAQSLLLRHRRQRARSPDPDPDRRPGVARHRPARNVRRHPHRRPLRRGFGYLGGRVDLLMMRVVDVLYSFLSCSS